MHPKIFLSLPGKNRENYFEPVKVCGAVPFGINFSKNNPCQINSDEFDGLILCGGGDIASEYYTLKPLPDTGSDIYRDECEMHIVREFLRRKKPILGICRGIQVINVALGGTLIHDIDLKSKQIHTPDDNRDYIHSVTAAAGSVIHKLYSSKFNVNSYHHQAVSVIGYGLTQTATSIPDMLTECLEHKTLPVIGVQWHPERMCLKHQNPSTVDGLKLFDYFISMCRGI